MLHYIAFGRAIKIGVTCWILQCVYLQK